MSATQPQDFNVRGYMYLTSVSYMRQTLGEQESKRLISNFSPRAQDLLQTLKAADWCPVTVFSEVTDALAKSGPGGDQSRDLVVKCGTYVAMEATNTFLKLFMKMMSPSLLIKKIPDLWKRDCTGGKLTVVEQTEKSVRFEAFGMQGYKHAVCTAAGFVSFGLGAIGKQVESVTIRGWSPDKPSEDGANFQLTWKN